MTAQRKAAYCVLYVNAHDGVNGVKNEYKAIDAMRLQLGKLFYEIMRSHRTFRMEIHQVFNWRAENGNRIYIIRDIESNTRLGVENCVQV